MRFEFNINKYFIRLLPAIDLSIWDSYITFGWIIFDISLCWS